MNNIILYDWFSLSSRADSPDSMLRYLQINDDSVSFTENYGLYGYKNRLEYGGISIHYNHWSADTEGVLLEMSGQGCRAFETYTDGDWDRLFSLALDTENGYNVTRLDIAYDDTDGLLDIAKIKTAAEKRNYIARSKVGTITNSFDDELDAISVMFGSKKSEYYVRFYDKAAERGGLNYHWVRAEQVLKHDLALAFLKLGNEMSIGEKYAGILLNYLRFVKASATESNKSRWVTEKWYQKFLGDCKRISLYTKKDVDYNMSRLEHYLQHQCGNSIETYIKCLGIDGLKKLLAEKTSKLTPDQRRLIESYSNGNVIQYDDPSARAGDDFGLQNDKNDY